MQVPGATAPANRRGRPKRAVSVSHATPAVEPSDESELDVDDADDDYNLAVSHTHTKQFMDVSLPTQAVLLLVQTTVKLMMTWVHAPHLRRKSDAGSLAALHLLACVAAVVVVVVVEGHKS